MTAMSDHDTSRGSSPALLIRTLESDEEILAAFPLMHCLRERLATAGAFLADVRRQQADGYALAGGFEAGTGRLVVLAGFRRGSTLGRGPHLFVDDLVTEPAAQGRGHGTAMVAWLRRRAAAAGLPRVWLDSRATAKGFYEQVGFTFATAIPCWIDADGGELDTRQ
jgi:ribosomal protein S18 acetylase RimI-like enzyme